MQSLKFRPSYLPAGKTAEQIAQKNGLAVQAAVLSYGAYDVYQIALSDFERMINPFWLMSGSMARGFFGNDVSASTHPEIYKALSPIYNIPHATQRQLPPQLLTVGSDDSVVTPQSVKAYLSELRSAGHAAQYWEYEGRPHAFLDSGSNALIGISFEADAPQALDVMIRFLDDTFY